MKQNIPSTTPKKDDKEWEEAETIEKENQIENDISLTVLAQLVATINIHRKKNVYHNDLMSESSSASSCHDNKLSSSSSSHYSIEKNSISFQNAMKRVKQFSNETLFSLHTMSLSHVLLSLIQVLKKWGNHLLTTTIEQLILLKQITTNCDINNTNPPIQ